MLHKYLIGDRDQQMLTKSMYLVLESKPQQILSFGLSIISFQVLSIGIRDQQMSLIVF